MSDWTYRGNWDHVEQFGRGIRLVSTPGHGGFVVSPGLNAKINEAWRTSDGCYEEDCEYAIVVLTFPERFDEKWIEAAHKTAKNWHPDGYEAVFGVKVNEADSYILRERAFDAATKDKFVVRAAWGDWAEDVPKGKVGVVAKRASDNVESWFLVDEDAYEARERSYVCTGNEPEWVRTAA